MMIKVPAATPIAIAGGRAFRYNLFLFFDVILSLSKGEAIKK